MPFRLLLRVQIRRAYIYNVIVVTEGKMYHNFWTKFVKIGNSALQECSAWAGHLLKPPNKQEKSKNKTVRLTMKIWNELKRLDSKKVR